MNRYLTALLAILPFLTTAQTPPGIKPATQKGLDVKFPEPAHLTIQPGQHVSEEDTYSPPSVLPPPYSDHKASYFIIMLDLDIPITENITETGLHWLARDLRIDSCVTNLSETSREQSIVAPYKYPNPLYNSGAHTYTLLLFKQPCDFVFPKAYAYLDPPKNVSMRIGFDTAEFVRVAGLGKPIGATYWTEINGTANGNATETDPGTGAAGGQNFRL